MKQKPRLKALLLAIPKRWIIVTIVAIIVLIICSIVSIWFLSYQSKIKQEQQDAEKKVAEVSSKMQILLDAFNSTFSSSDVKNDEKISENPPNLGGDQKTLALEKLNLQLLETQNYLIDKQKSQINTKINDEANKVIEEFSFQTDYFLTLFKYTNCSPFLNETQDEAMLKAVEMMNSESANYSALLDSTKVLSDFLQKQNQSVEVEQVCLSNTIQDVDRKAEMDDLISKNKEKIATLSTIQTALTNLNIDEINKVNQSIQKIEVFPNSTFSIKKLIIKKLGESTEKINNAKSNFYKSINQ